MKLLMFFRFSFLIALASYTSCGPGVIDYSEDLGDGYTYNGGNRIINADNIFEDGIFPNVLSYSFDSSYIIAKQEPSYKTYRDFLADDIGSKVEIILYGDTSAGMNIYSKNFLNSFWWKDTILRKKIAKEIGPNNQRNFEKISLIVDSVITTNAYYKKIITRKLNYWIIVKKGRKLLGPFSVGEYKIARQELKIPETLTFQN